MARTIAQQTGCQVDGVSNFKLIASRIYQEKYFDDYLIPVNIEKIKKIHFEDGFIIIEEFSSKDEK